ncbi:unnamed protein product [Discosporangium mesarthrocarpum]
MSSPRGRRGSPPLGSRVPSRGSSDNSVGGGKVVGSASPLNSGRRSPVSSSFPISQSESELVGIGSSSSGMMPQGVSIDLHPSMVPTISARPAEAAGEMATTDGKHVVRADGKGITLTSTLTGDGVGAAVPNPGDPASPPGRQLPQVTQPFHTQFVLEPGHGRQASAGAEEHQEPPSVTEQEKRGRREEKSHL